MGDESTKRAAQEYLAAKLSEEGQQYEDKLNTEAAIALAPAVWNRVAEAVIEKCRDWNAITGEQTSIGYDPEFRAPRARTKGGPDH